MKRKMLGFVVALVLGISLTHSAAGQITSVKPIPPAKKYEIDLVRMIYLPPGNVSIDIYTSDDVLGPLSASSVTVTFLPSNKVVPVSAINSIKIQTGSGASSTAAGGRILQIEFQDVPDAAPRPGDTSVRVEFSALDFDSGPKAKSVGGTGTVYTKANKDELVQELQKALKQSAANEKTSDEKNIFVGLNISVPSGGGDTKGDADIALNRTIYASQIGTSLFDKVNVGVILKKGSEDRADPRHINLGLTFRKTFLLGSDQITELRRLINEPGAGTLSSNNQREIARIVGNLQRRFVRAILWDHAMQFEGDVSGFSIGNISNLLYDGNLQVATISQAFAGRTGFWNFRLIPIGLEAGYNITNQDNPAMERHSLARLKTGAQLVVRYNAQNPDDFLSRIELEAKGVDRYLFQQESVFDTMTKMASLVEKGHKYWVQADLKFLFGTVVNKGRIGFKASFSRGSLPPIYAFTNAFKFGLVFESTDDDTTREIKIK